MSEARAVPGPVLGLFGLVALTFGSAVNALPVAAASGFHAAFAGESAFLLLSPGQSGQLAVGYTNTGDRPCKSGAANITVTLKKSPGSDCPPLPVPSAAPTPVGQTPASSPAASPPQATPSPSATP